MPPVRPSVRPTAASAGVNNTGAARCILYLEEVRGRVTDDGTVPWAGAGVAVLTGSMHMSWDVFG